MLLRHLLSSRELTLPAPRELVRIICASLRRDRHALALRLMEALGGWEKYDREIRDHKADLDTYVISHFYVFIDYLICYFSTGDKTYKNLYVGEKLKQLHDSMLTPEQDDVNRNRVTENDIQILCGHLGRELNGEAVAVLESFLRQIQDIVKSRGRKELKVLLIGDCIYLDVMGFLAPSALEDGISFRPTFIAGKNPIEQRNVLRQLANQQFDLICYSPFTYEFSPEFAGLHNWRSSRVGRECVNRVISVVMDDVEKNLDLLATLYDVPTYVHNTVNVRRHDSRLREITKAILTHRTRQLARLEVNRRLAELIAERRANDSNLILFDEAELLHHHGELALGRIIYATPIQHPAELGRFIAQRYREILAAHADLIGKKVVVCDLDNTLWEGEIGEGPVKHYVPFQRILKELRRKGVLLTINSKNDPRNICWDGAVLTESDFVHIQINWESKVANMRCIRDALNLKLKDFVFIDDRADQREMVREAMPEILVLDATSSRTWKQLSLWAAALPDNPETDRTQQYRERERRESFISGSTTVEEDPTALFGSLGIRVEIRKARPSELKRVTELINRTNQFNLSGTRTSLQRIRAWHDSPSRSVVVVEASDRFGPMGLVCASLIDLVGAELLIPTFVLSCRVFGYGIEDAVLSAMKRLACHCSRREPMSIRGSYCETALNEPCRTMYPRNGFSWDGQSWVIQHIEFHEYAPWLTIVDRLSSPSNARVS
jgi:FkbH-like protein